MQLFIDINAIFSTIALSMQLGIGGNMHGFFIVAHVIAYVVSPGYLVLTILGHIVMTLAAEAKPPEEGETYGFKFTDLMRKEAIWLHRSGPDGWLIFVRSAENDPPKIGEKILVMRKDETYSYEIVTEIRKYDETKRFGGGWFCRFEGWEEA